MTDTQLKPCPFCGDKMKATRCGKSFGHSDRNAPCPIAGLHHINIEKWNTRPPSYDDEHIEQLKSALQDAQKALKFVIEPNDPVFKLDILNGFALCKQAELKAFKALKGGEA